MVAQVHNIEEARPGLQQVYMCQGKFEGNESGTCECQCHLLLEEGVVKCARCLTLSAFEWFEPVPVPQFLINRKLRPKRSVINDDLLIYRCRKCSGVDMHLFAHGTVHCVRCKKQACARFSNPAEE